MNDKGQNLGKEVFHPSCPLVINLSMFNLPINHTNTADLHLRPNHTKTADLRTGTTKKISGFLIGE